MRVFLNTPGFDSPPPRLLALRLLSWRAFSPVSMDTHNA